MARSAAIAFVVMVVTLWLLPGVRAHDVVGVLGLVTLVAVVGALVRPLATVAATALGGPGALVLGAAAQAATMYVALRLDTDAPVSGIPASLAVSCTAAILSTALNRLLDAGTDETFVQETARLMRRIRRSTQRRNGSSKPGPGMLVVQLDGVSAPVLRWALRAGNLPTLGRWLREGTHQLTDWRTGIPATTPAAQAGILYGDVTTVPGYRWYDKNTGRPVVMSRSRDAARVEEQLPAEQGLLRDGGVGISNVFTGGAPTALFTVSRGSFPGRSQPGWGAFAASPSGFTRAVVLGLAEVIREWYQARHQRRRDVRPRIARTGTYLALRPAALLLRDANVSLIAEHMARGAPVIFCDFVDYDEVAHHAGPARPEAMAMLERLDHALAILQRLAGEASRDYHIVVLSDHGQSQGATFRQRHGETLHQVIGRLATPSDAGTGLHVAASGNLAMVYLTDEPGRAGRSAIEARHPGLIDGLATHPGIGAVVVNDNLDAEPVAVGRAGCHWLRTGRVDGDDPLLPYGPHAREDLLRHQRMAHVGDLVLLGAVDGDDGPDETAAFEELVGSHGGLGGWQTAAVLVHPAQWSAGTQPLVGPDAIHRLLTAWLHQCRHDQEDDLVLAAPGTDD